MPNVISLFPEYLEEKSKGGAVTALHQYLCTHGLGGEIEFDCIYGPKTTAAVKCLQVEKLDLTGDDVDGKFGPGTREACVGKLGWSPHLIPFEALPVKTTYVGGDQTKPTVWPLQK